jgi:hypothetical protein
VEIVTTFTLEKHEGPYEKRPLTSKLTVNGHDTLTRLSGFVIEGAYRCSAGYLIITSWDCPFEEANTFTLLNSGFEIVSQASLGVMYDTYLLEKHWPISASAIRLHYYGDFFYTLHLETSPWWQNQTPKLVLDLFEDFESDPEAMASLRDVKKKTEVYLQTRKLD